MRGGRADVEEDVFLGYSLCKASRHLEAAFIYER